MSNLGKKAIYKPQNLSLELQKFGNHSICWFSGPYSTLKQKFSQEFDIKINNQQIELLPSMSNTATKFYKLNRVVIHRHKNKNWSLASVKVVQSIIGALVGFKNFLRVRGVGYRFQITAKKLIINVGFSHTLQIKLPLNHTFTLNKKSTFLRVKNNNLAVLSSFLSSVRNLRKPDVYKGKGIRYRIDPIRLKEGKKKKTT
jgi:large subunit ribosomal protein L6